jgi:hypothetical protein
MANLRVSQGNTLSLRCGPNRLMRSIGLWRWYINITITFLDSWRWLIHKHIRKHNSQFWRLHKLLSLKCSIRLNEVEDKSCLYTCKIWGFHGGDYEEWCRFLQEPHGVYILVSAVVHEDVWGGVDVQIHFSFISALVGGERSAPGPCRYSPRGKGHPPYPFHSCLGRPHYLFARYGEVTCLGPIGTRIPIPL